MDVKTLAWQEKETVVSLRRHFHENPELSQKEFKTMDTIEEFLHKYGIETVRVPHGGVFGFLDSGKPGWTMLMRADIDALPIKEDPVNMAKERVCISENEGIMHACGHDGHMAMLLTEAKILAQHKDEWEGKIVFMFEEAEEMGERGIAPLLRYLRDNKIHIDTCFGTHVMWNLPAGKVGILYGSALAGAYFFRVKLHGKSGHGSRPDMAQSPIECFISIASELRSYRMRAIDPSDSLTYSFGCVQAGHEPNIIPDELMFAGTARCTKNDDGLAFRDTFLKVTKGIAELHGLTAEIVEDQYFPVTVNTKECVDLARKSVTEALGSDALDPDCPMWMATETFSITESTYPGVFFFTGINDPEVGSGSPHHTPKFDIAEDGLVTGVAAALAYLTRALAEKPETPYFQPTDHESMLKIT